MSALSASDPCGGRRTTVSMNFCAGSKDTRGVQTRYSQIVESLKGRIMSSSPQSSTAQPPIAASILIVQ